MVPGSDQYSKLAREIVKIHKDNLIVIGTVGRIPKPHVISNRLGNVPDHITPHNEFRGWSRPVFHEQLYIK